MATVGQTAQGGNRYGPFNIVLPPGLDDGGFGANTNGGLDQVSNLVLGGYKEMHTQNALAATSLGSSGLGMLAQVVPPLSPQDMPKLNFVMVALAAIPFATLVVRATYCVLMRWLAHGEILAMINSGQLPPGLGQKIVDDASRLSPETATIHPAQGQRPMQYATVTVPLTTQQSPAMSPPTPPEAESKIIRP